MLFESIYSPSFYSTLWQGVQQFTHVFCEVLSFQTYHLINSSDVPYCFPFPFSCVLFYRPCLSPHRIQPCFFFKVPQTEGTLHLAILKMSVARYGSILRDQVPRTPYNASNIHVLGIYTVAF